MVEEDKALVKQLLAWADSGDFGRGPSKTDLRRIAAARIEAMADEIEALRKAKWDVQHTDTMNDLVQMGMARDSAYAAGYAKAIEDAARVTYVACAETRHVTLGDKAAAAIRALAGKDEA